MKIDELSFEEALSKLEEVVRDLEKEDIALEDSMIKFILGMSIVLWFISMGLIYYAHYLRGVEDELGYISSDFRL